MDGCLEPAGYRCVSGEDFTPVVVAGDVDVLGADGIDTTVLVFSLEWLLLNPSLEERLHEVMAFVLDIVDEHDLFTLVAIPVLADLLLVCAWVLL